MRKNYLWILWVALLGLWIAWLFPWGLLVLLWGALSIRDDADITVAIATFITAPTMFIVSAISLSKSRPPGPFALITILLSVALLAVPAAIHAG